MEKRNIEITLNKAKKWYNSNNASLKELALQAFTEKELVQPYWKNIKTFEDATDNKQKNYSLLYKHLQKVKQYK